MKTPPSRSSASTVRYLLAAILGGIGVYFAWTVLEPVPPLTRAARSCPLEKTQYNVVQIYKEEKLDLTIFTFDNDAVSKEVLAHASRKVRRNVCRTF